MSVGKRIKERRNELHMSVDELATKLNKNRATIYHYEKGDIENLPIDILEPLAKALDTTPQYLMGWDKKLAGMRMADGDNESMYFAVSERSVKHVVMWHGAFGMDAFTDEEFEKSIDEALGYEGRKHHKLPKRLEYGYDIIGKKENIICMLFNLYEESIIDEDILREKLKRLMFNK